MIARAKRHGDRAELRRLALRRRQLPSQDPADPGCRRLRYVRYADDWLPGFAGPKHEAEEIKGRIAAFLRDELRLELPPSKTLITHAASQAARFLGYEIKAQHSDTKITRSRRAVNGAIGLFVPRNRIRQWCALYTSEGKPAQRGALLRDDDFTIIAKYQSEYAGRVQYYLLAQDVFRLGRLHWVMDLAAQDPRSQAPLDGRQDGPQAQGRHRHPRRAARVPATGHRARQGQEAAGRPLRRDTPAQGADSRPHRPAARHGQRQAERADPPAPCRALRTLRGHGGPSRSTTSASSQTSASQDGGTNPPGWN